VPTVRVPWSDDEVERMMGNLLRFGVGLAAVVVLLGGFVYLFRHGTAQPDYQVFRGEPADLRRIRGIVADAVTLRGRGIIQLGLLLLIATPIGRVVFSMYAFARQGDRIYVAATLIVLTILLYSLSGG
jgi:uncharacterized membrane protein